MTFSLTGKVRRLALYGLIVVPLLTDLIETGAWPDSPRAWVTEVVLAVVIAALVHRVSMDLREMTRIARVDSLTGLWNRRAFVEMLDDECARVQRTGEALTLVYLDLDHFKRVNDERGHTAGDQLLCHVAHSLQIAVRAHVDRCFRLGGDEFAVLLPGSSGGQAEAVLARIQTLAPVAHGHVPHVGISCGVVELIPDETPDDFVRRADREMYRQKAWRIPLAHLTL